MSANELSDRPRRWARLKDAVRYSPIGRSSLYKKAAAHPGLFRKDGAATIVDLDLHDEIIAALPAAKIKSPTTKKRAA
jgi:hypothetical protein